MLQPLKTGTTTDEHGRFRFKDLAPGQYRLEVSFLGYVSWQGQLKLAAGQQVHLPIALTPTALPGQEVVVEATRAREGETPVVFSNISSQYIQENHTVEDIPMMLTEIPNVFAYSDAGNGTGYSYVKIRGFDQKRVGVMVNGIPLNDPEDHQVYWVDLPDVAESLENIQIQRGVGSSLYGISTFGGSLNLLTQAPSLERRLEVFSNYGSYNSRKFGFEFNSGLLKNRWTVYARFSRLLSDGYRERSGTAQWAYFATISRLGDRSLTQINLYGGKEITHAAWDASPESVLRVNPRHNPITYENAIDNFSQPHFELHHTIRFSPGLRWKNSLFYIRGKGYYESLKEGRDLWEYGLAPQPDSLESDLIRQKWVAKNQYGWISEASLQHSRGELTLGTYLSLFNSDHWGEVDKLINPPFNVVGLERSGDLNFRYYQYSGDKYYITAFLNELYRPHRRVNVMVNLHFQHMRYQFQHGKAGNFVGPFRHTFEVNYNFFNPRVGVTWKAHRAVTVFGNVSLAQREPADDELYDIFQGPDDLGVPPLFARADTIRRNGQVEKIRWHDPLVKPERLLDLELGGSARLGRSEWKANLFWMNFHNEIVPFGQFDEEGNPIRGNAERTVHRGVELSSRIPLPARLEFRGNLSLNDNYFSDFKMTDYGGNQVDLSGNTIAGFPEWLANARLTYRGRGLVLSLHLQHVGKQYLDNTQNEDRIIPSFDLLNATALWTIKPARSARSVQFSLRLNNILDKRYFTAGYYDSWTNENYYWPGAGFNVIAGLRVGL
ncbi:MAG: TonB-dependent receptor [Calditrichaeota bacterium]|nr:MAG: TonB-dependent receptor [Calditrichota bacterium]